MTNSSSFNANFSFFNDKRKQKTVFFFVHQGNVNNYKDLKQKFFF